MQLDQPDPSGSRVNEQGQAETIAVLKNDLPRIGGPVGIKADGIVSILGPDAVPGIDSPIPIGRLGDFFIRLLETDGDARVYFALGRGAIGSGRLRSEAFVAGRLEEQLAEVAGECVTRAQCIQIERDAGKVKISSIFSWREKEFVAAYADAAPPAFATRGPIERAVLTFVEPKLLPAEKEFIAKNTFQVVYTPFDWTLNDLTGRGGR